MKVDESLIRRVLDGDMSALLEAFIWSDSPEGAAYWSIVHDSKKLSKEAHAKLEALLAALPKRPRGFALLSPERRREIASKGGRSVPPESRSFSQNPDLAREAGRKGGKNAPAESRSFSDRTLAQTAGRKGGRASHSKKD